MKQRADYTFRFNSSLGRHGWLRLTPAYSVKLVKEILKEEPSESFIFDPFSGTGTTGLVSAELGLNAALNDINPFLVWLANAKCYNYSTTDLQLGIEKIDDIVLLAKSRIGSENWLPDIFNIDRWWDKTTLKTISALRYAIVEIGGMPRINSCNSLFWISFCRLIIETSSAAFNHVSMSFSETPSAYEEQYILDCFSSIATTLINSAKHSIKGDVKIFNGDARSLDYISDCAFTHVITSPPYSNRISYIRELRPYMYWLGFLQEAKEAGDLDWEAIGGTWGTATSKLNTWSASSNGLPDKLYGTCEKIQKVENKNAFILGKYVLKYYHDMHSHFSSLRRLLAKDAKLIYIVGNSTFYGVPVPADEFLMSSLFTLGYDDVKASIIRKRNCKKELFEYCISAVWNKTNDYAFNPMKQNEALTRQLMLNL